MQMILEKLYTGNILSQNESFQLFSNIVRGEVEPTSLVSAIISMKVRGERAEEIAGAAIASLEHANSFARPEYPFADIVGTGGDGANSINISTASAFVSAACGFPVAKHGNRGVSSRSGSSDVLAAFGVNLNMSATSARKALDELGVCFLFAQQYHSGFKHAAAIRQTLKTRTIFNVLGPLINPAKPTTALIGVYSPDLILPVAETLRMLNYKHAAVVHCEGLDEVAIHGTTQVAELHNDAIVSYKLTATDFGLPSFPLTDLQGGSPEDNRDAIALLLQGVGKPAHEAAVAANVSLLMRMFGHQDLKENATFVMETIKSGKPYQLIQNLATRG